MADFTGSELRLIENGVWMRYQGFLRAYNDETVEQIKADLKEKIIEHENLLNKIAELKP